ncbi:MAG: hypothetical protein PHU93_01560 [Candidatus Gracilibacteria bacterium]|nr:hypothetical protein [Candidatus Gracilibacteria bacterium]
MNQILPDPEANQVSYLLQTTADNLRAELARKRAQRNTELALKREHIDNPPVETLPKSVPIPTVLTQKIEPQSVILDSLPIPRDIQNNTPLPPVFKTPITEVDFLLDLTLDTGGAPPDISDTPSIETKNQATELKVAPLSSKALHYASIQRDNVRALLKNDTELPLHITEDAVLKSVAIIQTQEEMWDSLKINQISIPLTEVSLWSSFFKIFTKLGTERYLNHPFEKGDTFELKIPGFHMFHMTRIRKSEKESLTFCVVQSKLHPNDSTYIFEVLVKLPIREGGMLEIYRNRVNGPEQINSWKISEILLKRPKSALNYEAGSEKSGILGILGL